MISIPFSGNKRYSYKFIQPIVEVGGYDTVYEPFGGSCVLTVNLFNDGLIKRGVVNDYDHFFDLYPEYLDLKDKVVDECYKRGLRKVKHDSNGYFYNDDNGEKVRCTQMTLGKWGRAIVQDVIKEYVPKRFWYHFCLGTNFAWSVVATHEKISLGDFTLFSRKLTTKTQRSFIEVLNNLEKVNLDWHDFIDKYENEINDKSLIILDPPYIGTTQIQYAGQFSVDDTKELIDRVSKLGCDFIFFNDNQDLVEEWLEGFDYEITDIGTMKISTDRRRSDVMAYVKV